MKDHNICSQYYKDLESGVEMLFRFDTQRGWSVSFINLEDEQDVKFVVPFPKDPEKYKEHYSEPYVFSKLIGMEDPSVYDGVSLWQCPHCKSQWECNTGELVFNGDGSSIG